MKNITLFTCLLVFIFSNGLGQTKKIFHKSHSGKAGTLFLDENNNFGPGMAPIRYQTPESPIQLKYYSTATHKYPRVILDTIGKTMRFFDTKDSLIGCDRDYREYLNHGSLVFDVSTSQFWVYQLYFYQWDKKQIRTNRFLMVTDSIAKWESKDRYIRNSNDFIRDGNNFRILMSYSILHYTATSNLKPELINPQESFPVIISDKINKKEKTNRKKVRQQKELNREELEDDQDQKNKEEFAPVFVPKTPPFNLWLIWMGIFFFAFSAFIFLGVKQIVKEELTRMNFKR